MLILLSPAKKIDARNLAASGSHTMPQFIHRAQTLAQSMRALSPASLASLLAISDQLAATNVARYAEWDADHHSHNAKQAVFSYAGDVYQGLKAASLTPAQVDWTQKHVRILSGLYGYLRPLDLIQPYRLEMGTKLPNAVGADLYAFWRALITRAINRDLHERPMPVVVNLASEEHSRAVDIDTLDAPMITPVFQERKNGQWKIVPIHAKRARGMMARYAAEKALTDPSKLQAFDSEGYDFDRTASDERRWVFRR
jgi:hypothetical protein